MDMLNDLFANEFFLSAGLGWLIAQFLKTIIYCIVTRSFDPERLIGSGGMPSSHSATVMGLLVAAFFNYGTGSFEFAISLFFAIVVMHDARGVRRETGLQAHIINEMVEWMNDMGNESIPADIKLKEFVGHSPTQVLMGALLGAAVGIGVHYFFLL